MPSVMLFFFVCVYVCIWLSQYFTLKRKVRQLNKEFSDWKKGQQSPIAHEG
ncbi:MAG: DUF3021 family protein [Lachnospiraceae bacterium]|nr:DUF3021 family protein [Lachnospiraceae bacterium]